MKRHLLPVLMAAVGLVGCKHPDPVTIIQRVEVPIPVPCPPPPGLSRPVSHVDLLPVNAAPDQVVRAILADLTAWIGFAMEQETLLNAYRKPAPEKK